jgi:hypothetical protein
MQHNKVNRHTHTNTKRIINTKSFLTTTTVRLKIFNVTFLSTLSIFYSLEGSLNQNSIASCSRKHLIQFPPHNCMFERTGFTPLMVLNIKNSYYTLEPFLKSHSPEACYKFLFLTVCGCLVLAFTHPQRP